MGGVVYYPGYLPGYACKCGACRRTCCSGRDWSIAMTEAERDAALAACGAAPGGPGREEPGLAEALRAAEARDGLVALPCGEDGRCRLLGPDGMCEWRRRLGSDLCAVCRDYPVSYIRLGRDVFAWPSGGCEAVLEALASAGRVTLESCPAEDWARGGGHAFQLDASEADVAGSALYACYPAVVGLALGVLQDEARVLDERVAVLVQCLDAVCRVAGAGAGVETGLGRLVAGLGEPGRVEAMARAARQDARPGNPAARVCSELYRSCLDSEAYAPMARRALEGLGFGLTTPRNPKARPKVVLRDPALLEAGRARWASVAGRHGGLLGRVAANVFMHSGAPLAAPDPWSSARYFAICYALVKFGVAGTFEDVPGEEELIDFLVEALRAFEHNAGFYRSAVRWADGVGLTGAADVAKMVMW